MAVKTSSSLRPSKRQKTGISSSASASSPLKAIVALEVSVASALAANASLNPLVDLLHIATARPDADADAEITLKAVFALYRLFTLVSKKGILSSAVNEDNDRKVVRAWVASRFDAFTELLCALLKDEEKTLRISSLKILFSVLRQLSSSIGKLDEASSSTTPLQFDSKLRRGQVVGEEENLDGLLDPDVRDLFLETWLNVYADIRWFFLRETAALLETPTFVAAHPSLPANVLSILEKLTGMPSSDVSQNSAQSSFWIEELNAKPKLKPSKVTSDSDDDDDNNNSEDDNDGEKGDDWRLFFDEANPSKDAKKSKQKGAGGGRRLHTLSVHAQLHTPTAHRVLFTRCWLSLLPLLSGDSLPSRSRQKRKANIEDEEEEEGRLMLVTRALTVLHHGVLPHLTRTVLIMDWVAGCVDHGENVGLLALNALFVLMREYNLDYPQFYTRLYAFLDRNVLHLRNRARFFRLTELFLSSSHLPAMLLASFVKRLARLSLSAPPAAIIMTIPFTYNILKRHPALMSMIHRFEFDPDSQLEENDPFKADEPNPMQTNALQSSLWELAAHRQHYHGAVSTLARVFEAAFTRPAYAMEDFLDHTYTTLFETEVNRRLRREPVVSELELAKPLVVRKSNVKKTEGEEGVDVPMDVRYPEVDELVMVQVQKIAEMGAYVRLLEYDNIEGMILLSELSRRRIRSIQKLIRVGRNEVVVVLRVDREKGYIDLSKRRVSPEDITKCEERYIKSKTVSSILRQVAKKLSPAEVAPSDDAEPAATKLIQGGSGGGDEEVGAAAGTSEDDRVEALYEQIGWPLGKQYGHPYDAFKLALTESDKVFSSLATAPSPAVLAQLTATIARRLTPQPIKLRADVELTCYTDAGIDAIKRALRAGEAAGSETVPIKAKLVAPPLYVLGTNATDKYAAVERLERAIERIQSTIEEEGGSLVVKMKASPKAVSETDEQDLAQLMAKAGQENAEVSGDEEEEELQRARARHCAGMAATDVFDDVDVTDALETKSEKDNKSTKGGKGSASSKVKDLSHVPCKFFRVGSCTAGSSCPFSHHIVEPGQHKDVCAWFVKGNCKFGHKCALAHILPGQSMTMDRRNKKAAQLAASSSGGAAGQKDRDSRDRDRERDSRGRKSATGTGQGIGRAGAAPSRNGLLSGSTAPTRVLSSGARPPLPISKAIPAPAAPAPALQDADFTSFDFTKTGEQTALSDVETQHGPENEKAHESAFGSSPSVTMSPPLDTGVFPVSTPSQPLRFTGRHGSSSSIDFGPVGSPPRASPTNPIRINGFSPGSSPRDAVPHTQPLAPNPTFSASGPGTGPSQNSFMHIERGIASTNDFKNRSGLAASLGTGQTLSSFNVGSLPVLSRGPASVTDKLSVYAEVIDDEDMEDFVPSSLKDLLTPEEQSRRMSRTSSAATAGGIAPVATTVARPGAGVQDNRHRHSRSVPAPSILQDIRTIWADSDGELSNTSAQKDVGTNTGFGFSSGAAGMLGTGPSSFKSSYTDGPSPSMLHPTNASAAFLPGLHHYMSRAPTAGVRAVSHGNAHLQHLHQSGLVGVNVGQDNHSNGNDLSVSPSHVGNSAMVSMSMSMSTTNNFDAFSSPLQRTHLPTGRPIPPSSGTHTSTPFRAPEHASHLSPSSRALQAHAPGQSLPQGLAAGYSRIHLQPSAVTSTSPASAFSPGSAGQGLHGLGPPGSASVSEDWMGANMTPTKQRIGQTEQSMASTVSPPTGAGLGGHGEQTNASTGGSNETDLGGLTSMFSHLSYSSVARAGVAGLGHPHGHQHLHAHGGASKRRGVCALVNVAAAKRTWVEHTSVVEPAEWARAHKRRR
ncbi:hypothetical protein EW145_g7089 [Phellinidium pouzarii]|uniref:S1 motif domain-containing protein n=1 Tax=Phellinidium pouzarii TaxID=167371 RepID=A0A4S4KQ57_9AGAM|nr:hypothetical protein EW145_g7089 [Phellinidium pouzarii]